MALYSLDDFARIPRPEQFVSSAIAFGDLPTMEEVKKLAKWDTDLLSIFDDDPTKKKFDRSMAMTHFAYSAAENGWTDEQLLVALRDIDDRWKKYSTRTDRDARFLVPMIDRARRKVGYDVPDIDIKALLAKKATDTADRIRVYGAAEFADADFHVDWLLDGLLPEGGMGLVTGYPGVGKTQFAIQMGCQLALGDERFLRWENKSGRKKVLFLSLEMGPTGLHAIWNTIMDGYAEKRQLLDRNFKVYPIGEPVPLDTEPGQRFMHDLMEEWKPDVLILDSLQKIISKEATDEASAKTLMHYLSTLKARYGCSIVVVHHNRKRPNEGKTKHVISLSDVFGSVFLTAEPDFVVNIDKRGKGEVDIKMLKNRYGPDDHHFVASRNEHLQLHDDLRDLKENFDDDDDPSLGRFGL